MGCKCLESSSLKVSGWFGSRPLFFELALTLNNLVDWSACKAIQPSPEIYKSLGLASPVVNALIDSWNQENVLLGRLFLFLTRSHRASWVTEEWKQLGRFRIQLISIFWAWTYIRIVEAKDVFTNAQNKISGFLCCELWMWYMYTEYPAVTKSYLKKKENIATSWSMYKLLF